MPGNGVYCAVGGAEEGRELGVRGGREGVRWAREGVKKAPPGWAGWGLLDQRTSEKVLDDIKDLFKGDHSLSNCYF